MPKGVFARGRTAIGKTALTAAFGAAASIAGATIAAAQQAAAAVPSATTSWSVTVDPYMPLAAVGALGAVYLAFCLMAARQRIRGAWLRAAAGGVLALALVNPEITAEKREPLPTEVAVVVDRTASQKIGARETQTNAAYAALMRRLSEIQGVKVRTIDVASSKDPATGDGSQLFKSLDTALSDVPRDRLGAVIMMTDGQVHDVPAGESEILSSGAPLHVLVSGSEGERDRRIVIEQSPRFGLISAPQKIAFRVIDDGGDLGAGKIEVKISVAGKEIATKLVTPGELTEVTLNIPAIGSNIVELKTDSVAGEITDVNNRVVASIEGIRENLSVLLVSGEPNAGVRIWRSLLKSDPGTDLVHFTILRPPGKQDLTPVRELSLVPFPTQELFSEKIGKFDLIVFDHYKDRDILSHYYFENIARYVKDGGALLVIAGPEYGTPDSVHNSPLAGVLPARPKGSVTQIPFVPKISETGKKHPVTRDLAALAAREDQKWGRWLRSVDVETPSGHVVMEGPNGAPLLVLERKDKGRVALMLSDNAWLWARGHEGGGPHAEMMRQIAQWLMKDAALEEESLKLSVAGDKLVVELQTMAEKPAPVKVKTPSGELRTVMPEAVSPGIWRTEIPAAEFGIYTAERDGDKPVRTAINVGPASPREFAGTISTLEPLKPAVDATGGSTRRMVDAAGVTAVPRVEQRRAGQSMKGDDWIGLRMTEASTLKDVSRTPLIPPWLGFAFIVGLLGAAWWREGEKKLWSRTEKTAANGTKPDNGPAPAP